ncbi:MAG TPA: carboxypeptidase-like regulatory domain-containing protein, partial [Chitinophagaceae bacterium]
MRKIICLLLLACIGTLYTNAQDFTIKGRIIDTTENKPIQFAVVTILKNDSSLVSFTRTDKTGAFNVQVKNPGKYVYLVSYPKFADLKDNIEVNNKDLDLGKLALTPKSVLLEEVIVRTGSAIRIKGDTTEFTADSFVVKEGATVEDLMKKLPGFQVNSKGEIIAHGKRVDKVLVDGEEFFGDDPTMATQNLSAKIVDKVQVYDTKTEQQNLTGITSGNEGKTVNIKLKEDKKTGSFGKAHAASDFNKYTDAKALYNRFVGKKKLSLYGTKSDINTGSLNWEDRQKLGMENDMEYDEIGGFYYSF